MTDLERIVGPNAPQRQLSEEARHLALVPLFQRLDENDLAKLAEEVDQVFFQIRRGDLPCIRSG